MPLLNEKRNPLHTAAFLVALGAVYLLVGLYSLGQHLYLGETDTTYFFVHVQEILKQGNTWDLLKSFFSGTFTENNQSSLFPFIISFFYEQSAAYFVHIKVLNLFLGLLYVYLLYFLVRRESNEMYALIAACALVANDIFMHQSTMVSCEPLLMIVTTLSFYFIIKGLDDNRFWILAGLFAGLSYMTKPSGLFIVFGFGLFLLYDRKMNLWALMKNKYLWMFLLMFVLVCLPLLVRNTILYKFPFYTINMDMLAMDQNWGQTDQTEKFTDIFKKGIADNAYRFFWGLAREFRILLHSLYSFSVHYVPKFSWDLASMAAKAAAALLSVLTLGISLFGFFASGMSRRKKALIVFLVLGFYLPLSWYSITSPNRRYLLPVVPFFLVFFAVGLVHVAGKVFKTAHEAFPERVAPVKLALTAALLVFAVAYPLARPIPAPASTYRAEDGYEELAAFFKNNLKGDEKYFSKGIHHYSWVLLHPELESKKTAKNYFPDIESFNAYFASKKNIKYMLMQPELYRATKNILGDYVALDRTRGLVLLKDIPGWKKIKIDTAEPVDYILFERSE